MRLNSFKGKKKVAALAAAIGLGLATQAAVADTFNITYLAAGVQTPAGITPYYTKFDTLTPTNGSLITHFGGSSITGTYSGNFRLANADQYGGAGGTGKYITTPSAGTDTLSLSQGVNYLGLWFSALDGGNQLKFYSGNTLLLTYLPVDFIAAVGACGGGNPYCGNPNGLGDNGEQFAYLNFYDKTGLFDKVEFTQVGGGGFEADNISAANVSGPIVGTSLNPVPEPSGLALLGTGIVGLAGAARRRFLQKA